MSMIRSFVAVPSSDAVVARAASLIERLAAADAKVTWVLPENMHWTLKFLGDVELTQSAAICQAVSRAAHDIKPFDIEVRGAGAFPHTERPRTLWLGAGEGRETMIELAGAIDAELSQLGFKPEHRRHTPHLTIGRVRGSRNIHTLGREVVARESFDAGRMAVDEVIVFSSRLEPQGPVYEILGRARLG